MFENKMDLDKLDRKTIASVSERVVNGPQEEVMNEIMSFNNTYNSDIGITKTFRWKPGFYDKIRNIYTNDICGWRSRSNKVSTFFNKINNSSWRMRNFQRQLNNIDRKLANLRSIESSFQDNTDLVEEKLRHMQDMFNGVEQLNDDEFETDIFLDEADINDDVPMVYFRTVVKEGTKMNVFTSDNRTSRRLVQQIPYAHDCVLLYQIPLIPWLNKLTKYEDVTRITTLNNIINSRMVASGTNGNMKCTAKFKNVFGLRHVYISNGAYHNDFVFVCEGNLAQDLRSSLLQLDFTSYMFHVRKWMTEYVINVTQPMNPITTMYHGCPEYLTEDYKKIISHSKDGCYYPNLYGVNESTRNADVYCDKVSCTFRSSCEFYINQINQDTKYQIEALTMEMIDISCIEDEYYMGEVACIVDDIGDIQDKRRFASYFLSMKDNPRLVSLALFTKDCKNKISERHVSIVYGINDLMITHDDPDADAFMDNEINWICERQVEWLEQMLNDEGHTFESLDIDFELANTHYKWIKPKEKRVIKVQKDNQVVLDLDGKTAIGHTDSWYEDTDGVWKKLTF